MTSLTRKDYTVVSVEPADTPKNASGTGWHCYVIEQGDNLIRGYKQGNTGAVRRSVEEMVWRLNERRRGKMGRVHLTMSSSRKK